MKKYFDILGGPATFIQVCIVYGCLSTIMQIMIHGNFLENFAGSCVPSYKLIPELIKFKSTGSSLKYLDL